MKIVRFHEYGGPEVLQVEDVPEPEPGPCEVRVRAEAIGVGAPDILVRTGTDVKTWPLPMIPGNDMAGTVDAIGDGVTRFQVGDRVYVPSRELPLRGGSYVEARTIPEAAPFAIPEGVAAEQVVALGNYHVAWMLLNHAVRLEPGETIPPNDRYHRRLRRDRQRAGPARPGPGFDRIRDRRRTRKDALRCRDGRRRSH